MPRMARMEGRGWTGLIGLIGVDWGRWPRWFRQRRRARVQPPGRVTACLSPSPRNAPALPPHRKRLRKRQQLGIMIPNCGTTGLLLAGGPRLLGETP